MRFFLDANVPHSSLEVFKELNLEAAHARDAGLSRANDKEIINYAAKEKSVLVKKDLEFANTKLFPLESHNGAIILRLPHTFKAKQFADAIRNFLTSVEAESLEKSITIVKLGRYRIRKF